MIKLAYTDPFPPFAINKKGEPVGLAIEILLQSFARRDLELAFIPEHISKIQDLLPAGKAHALAFWAINPERRKKYDFSDPYVFTGGALFTKAPNKIPSDLEEFENKAVVTPEKGALAGFIKREFPGATLVMVEDYFAAMSAILNGKADVAALNLHVGTYLANQLYFGQVTIPKTVFIEVCLAIAVLKGSQASLLGQFNKGLRSIKEDGTYAQITEKWSKLS